MAGLARWRPHPEAMRFVPLFLGVNLVGSLNLVFFPSWLASIGLDAPAIGLLMGAMGVARVIAGPAVGIAADAWAARRMMIVGLMAVAAAAYAGFAALHGIAFVVICALISAAAFSSIGPLLDGVTLRTAMMVGFDYGRVRMCGSAAFVAMNLGGGALVAASGIGVFPPAITIAGLLSFAAAWLLPRDQERPHPEHAAQVRRQAWALARQPLFVLFVATAGIAQACHSFYYGFGTLNWHALGYPADLVGLLWALGVVAEIILFSVSGRVVARLGPIRLLVIGTACGLVRWTVLAFSPPLWIVIAVQVLHAGTFCAAHLGAMHFILRATPHNLVGTAQSLYAAATVGIFFTLAQYASGLLFASAGSLGYLAMTAMSGVSLLLALLLGQMWNGGILAIETTEP